MKEIRRIAIGVALLGVFVLASASFAQDAVLIEAAKREGKVAWYTSLALPSSTALAHLFAGFAAGKCGAADRCIAQFGRAAVGRGAGKPSRAKLIPTC